MFDDLRTDESVGVLAEADARGEFGRVPCAFAVGGVSAEQVCAERPTRPDDGEPPPEVLAVGGVLAGSVIR